MAWPPPVLPINRTNATAQLDTHANDHNAVNGAMNDTTTRLQSLIDLQAADDDAVNARVDALDAARPIIVQGFVTVPGGHVGGANFTINTGINPAAMSSAGPIDFAVFYITGSPQELQPRIAGSVLRLTNPIGIVLQAYPGWVLSWSVIYIAAT